MADGVVNNDPPALKNPIDWYEHKAQLMRFLGMNTFSKDLLEFGHNQGWNPGPYVGLVNTPSWKDRWGKIIDMLQNYELDVLPYYEYSGTIGPEGLGMEKRARPLGDSLENNNYTHVSWTEKANADITDPDTYSDLKKILERTVVDYKDEANFVGAWLRPRPSANPVSFSDAALQRFSTETNHGPVTREELRTNSRLYDKYLQWWFGKRKDFLMAMRDYLKEEEVNDDPVVLYTTDATESGRTHPDWSQSHNIITDDKAAWGKLTGDYPVFSLKEKINNNWHLKAQLLPVKTWDDWEWNHSVPPPDPDNATKEAEVVVRKIETKANGTYLAVVNTGLKDKFGVTITIPRDFTGNRLKLKDKFGVTITLPFKGDEAKKTIRLNPTPGND